MRFVNLEQRTPQWLAWRKTGITATESAVIAGLSPWQTPWRLWAEKTGRTMPADLSGNPLVRYGQEHEDDARALFERRHGEVLLPACAEYEKDPLFRASFDGLTAENIPVEFKCPSDKTLAAVRASGERSEPFKRYAMQLQHQMLVAEAPQGWLVFYDGAAGELIEFEVARDESVIQNILTSGREFWNRYVVKGKEPPKDEVRDVFTPKGAEQIDAWCRLAYDYVQASQCLADLQRQVDELHAVRERCKAGLVELMGDYRCADFAGVALTRRCTAGGVDYAKFLKAKGLDKSELEAYRRKPTESVLVRLTDRQLPKDSIDDDLAAELALADTSESMWF